MRKRSELFFNTLLLPLDFLAITAAFILAYYIRVQIDGRPVANPLGIVLFLKIILLIIPVWIAIFALTGLYNMSSLRGRLEEVGKIFVAVSGGTMFVILVDFVSRQPIFPSKSIPIYGYILSFLFVVISRQLVRWLQRHLFRYDVGVHRAVIIGSGDIAQKMAEDLSDTAKSGYRIVGVVDSADDAAKLFPDYKVYKSFAKLQTALGKSGFDEFIQADSALEGEEILEMVNYAGNHHLGYRFVPNQFGLFATNSTISTLSGMPVVEIKHTPLDGWGRVVKRTFDILSSLLGLIVLSPFFAVVAVLIKLSDPGQVFYRQRRLSRYGRSINIYKFRTMYQRYCTGEDYGGKTNAEAFAELGQPELVKEFSKENKLERDPRVSPLGSFLRRTSIDELPQLINVLRGDLSLVGPRPMLEDELDRFGDTLPQILALRCGVTGLWQVSGRSDIGFDGRVKMDLYYVENWSLYLDIKIILRTIWTAIRRSGAY